MSLTSGSRLGAYEIAATADAGSYVFGGGAEQSDLFLVEGLR
jgi:hypothetical protein